MEFPIAAIGASAPGAAAGSGTMMQGGSMMQMKGRIASPGMLLEKFPPMIGSAPPNRVGGAHGGNYQHGRAARGFVSGGGALPVGRAGSEGAHSRRVVPDDGLGRPDASPAPPGRALVVARLRRPQWRYSSSTVTETRFQLWVSYSWYGLLR
jgi:hypothetical protein